MILLHRLASIVRWIFRRNRAEAELNDEMQSFIDMAAADHVRDGATPAGARRLAALQLGGLEQAKERVRTGRHGGRLHCSAGDVLYRLPPLPPHPAFSNLSLSPPPLP